VDADLRQEVCEEGAVNCTLGKLDIGMMCDLPRQRSKKDLQLSVAIEGSVCLLMMTVKVSR